MGVKIEDWINGATDLISWVEAGEMVQKVMGYEDFSDVIIRGEVVLSDAEVLKLNKMLLRRDNDEPMAYILGWKEFYGEKFKVNKHVMIPRLETEQLVEIVLSELYGRYKGVLMAYRANRNIFTEEDLRMTVAEVGVGSGCVIGSIAMDDVPMTSLVACDISESALKVAERNLKRLGCLDQVELYKGDLFVNWQKFEKGKVVDDGLTYYGFYDIIVANLPYVDRDWDWNSPGLKYEPEEALFAGDGGLEIIIKFLKQARGRLKPNGVIFLELDESQKERLIEMLPDLGYGAVADPSPYVLSIRVDLPRGVRQG